MHEKGFILHQLDINLKLIKINEKMKENKKEPDAGFIGWGGGVT